MATVVPKLSIEITEAPVKETTTIVASASLEDGEYVNQYIIHRKIGEGAFGTVYVVKDSQTDQAFAMKVITKERLRRKTMSAGLKPGMRRPPSIASSPLPSPGLSPMDELKREVAIMKKLNHPNIIRLYEVLDAEESDSLFMIMELADRGSVMEVDAQSSKEPLPIDLARKYFRDVVLGVEYLHFQDIAHRDLKPDNLMLSSNGRIKIGDFGVSESYDDGNDLVRKSAGSPAFMAPEMCKAKAAGEVYSAKKTDIWAMGVILYCFVTGHPPFRGPNVFLMSEAIREQELQFPDGLSEDLRDLISQLLRKNPEERLTLEQIKVHPWLTEGGKFALPTTEVNCAGQPVKVTDSDIRASLTPVQQKISSLMTVVKAVGKFRLRASSVSGTQSS